jgi:hexosaminidase
VHWLGWEGLDFDLTVDLGTATTVHDVSIGTLYDPHSWILHPRRVTCAVSADGVEFQEVGTQAVGGDQRKEEVTRTFVFTPSSAPARFVRLHVEGTKQLPDWHASAGGTSWVFVDEIVVR